MLALFAIDHFGMSVIGDSRSVVILQWFILSWNRLIPPNFKAGLTMMNNNFPWSKQQNPRLPLPWAAVAGSRSEDYELSAEEASELIAALGGTSQQRAGYREPLGNQSTVDRSGMEKPRAK